MLLIPVRVRPSNIEGNGLFALADHPAGTPVWRFQPGFDQAFPPGLAARLPELVQAHLRHFAWQRMEDGAWILSGDLACFMNHSESPNTGMPAVPSDAGETVCLRAIRAGEELTCDYFAFDAAAREKLRPGTTLP